jgi:hypothetical protein
MGINGRKCLKCGLNFNTMWSSVTMQFWDGVCPGCGVKLKETEYRTYPLPLQEQNYDAEPKMCEWYGKPAQPTKMTAFNGTEYEIPPSYVGNQHWCMHCGLRWVDDAIPSWEYPEMCPRCRDYGHQPGEQCAECKREKDAKEAVPQH